ncbi:MAG: hypothetical protein E4G95_01390, partial [Bacteroidia bacterium]
MILKKIASVILIYGFSFTGGLAGESHHQVRITDTLINNNTAPAEYPEQVFVHTDRSIYIAGEDIWFSLYLLDAPGMAESERSVVAYLEVVSSSNTPVAQIRSGISNGFATGSIHLPDTITTDFYFLRAYTNLMKNSGPDSFFHQDIFIFNPFKEQKLDTTPGNPIENEGENDFNALIAGDIQKGISRISVRDSFGTREKVNIQMIIDTSCFEKGDRTSLSISVAVASNSMSRPSMDTFLNKIKPGPGFSEESIELKYPVESFGPVLEGTILYRQTLAPASGLRLYLSTPSVVPEIMYSFSDSLGNFRFTLGPEEGMRDIVIQPADFAADWLIRINPPFSNQFSNNIKKTVYMNGTMAAKASRMGINYQLCNIYSAFAIMSEYDILPRKTAKRFYGRPDIEITLSDYIPLPTIEEVIHELAFGVSLRRQKSVYNLYITDDITGERIANPDIVLINGLLINDMAIIATLDPELVERIDIIKGRYQVGSVLFKGILSIILKESESAGYEIPVSGMRTQYSPLARTSYAGKLSYGLSRPFDSPVPDLRNTLLWESKLRPDNNGVVDIEFFTSDFCSDYLIT